MSDYKYRHFLYATMAGEKIEREVSKEEWIRAERAAGFRPRMASDDPDYMNTYATGGFSSSGSIGGRLEFIGD